MKPEITRCAFLFLWDDLLADCCKTNFLLYRVSWEMQTKLR